MPEAVPVFTIARIAGLLGCDRKTVREQFTATAAEAAQATMVKGQAAKAWRVADMPAAIQERLGAVAKAEGFAGVETMLAKGRGRWMPPVPLGKISPAQIQAAQTRCSALAPAIRANRDLSVSEIVSEAAALWKRSAGYDVDSERTLRRWIDRAMERDRGYEEWERWALYLDDQVTEVPAATERIPAVSAVAERTRDALEHIAKPSTPTDAEREIVWVAAMTDADTLEQLGGDASAVQKSILECLNESRVPLAANREALRVAYRRKRAAWYAGGGTPSAIADKRAVRNSERRFELPANDHLLLLRYYSNCGDLASAFRLAMKNRVLSEATLARFAAEPRDKSHVPHSVRQALASDILAIDARKLGPRAAAMNCGYLDRDPSGIEPGDWWEADDLTPPIYYWDDSQAPFFFGRGQILMMRDFRSWCILGYCLISARGYNARAIRQLITICHDKHGLPRNGFHFERGMWERARILKGTVPNNDQSIPIEEMELGLREFGLHFHHTHSPRAKMIERTFGLLQNKMEKLPGYCGRDERKDCPERLSEQIVAVNSGRVHPSAYFMHRDQWITELDRLVAEFNAERHGPRAKWIPGQSPAEKYAERTVSDVIHLSADFRHLLASHRLPVKVTANGIRLPSGLGGGRYRSEDTGKIIGQRVLAWVDPDDLSSITITDLDRQNPRVVEVARPVSAMADDPAELAAAAANLQTHNSHGNTVFRAILSDVGEKGFRPVVVDQRTAALGQEFRAQKAAHQEARREAATLSQRFEHVTTRAGLSVTKPTDLGRLRALVDGLQAPPADWESVKAKAQEDVDL